MALPTDPSSLLARVPFIPVLTIETVKEAVPLTRALAAGGLHVQEITLRTPAALDVIRAIATECPDVVVGAGTLLTVPDVEAAMKAGAHFLVSPGAPARLAAAMAQAGIPALPGCATVSEAMTLAEQGFKVLKFFPAEASGGTDWLKAAQGPLPTMRFCPTGGVDRDKAASYLALSNVICVGGTWVAPKDAVAAGDFARVTALAKAAAALRS